MTLGDVTIYNVTAPERAMPGEQPIIVVDVQFHKPTTGFYCRIINMETGDIPYVLKRRVGSWSAGAVASITMEAQQNHFMPPVQWPLRIEIGNYNLFNFPSTTDYAFLTIYEDAPLEDCSLLGPGYYWDPITNACVLRKGNNKMLWIGGGLMVLASVASMIYAKKKPKKPS